MNTTPPSPTTPPGQTAAAMPTVGAVVGSALGSAVLAHAGLDSDPYLGASVVAAITAMTTALFHWLGTKLGQPNL